MIDRPTLKKYSIIGGVVLVVAILAFIGVSYLLESRYVTVTFEDIKEVRFTEYDSHGSAKISDPIKVSDPDSTVRFKKDTIYSYDYTAASGDFADGAGTLDTDMKTLHIKPDFSDQKIAALAEAINPEVKQTLSAQYDRFDQYKLVDEWVNRDETYYITRLAYIGGEDILGNDTLITIFHKSNDSWQMVCKPEIVFTETTCPDVPRVYLEHANKIGAY